MFTKFGEDLYQNGPKIRKDILGDECEQKVQINPPGDLSRGSSGRRHFFSILSLICRTSSFFFTFCLVLVVKKYQIPFIKYILHSNNKVHFGFTYKNNHLLL